MFPVWRYHPFFTNSAESAPAADITHRRHAVIEILFADLIDGPFAHMPSGSFAANSAWVVLAAITHNLLRAAGTLAGQALAVARGATLRRQLVNVPARFVRPQGRPTLRLPAHWPHAKSWTSCGTTSSAERPPSKSRPNTAAGSPDGYIDPDQAIWFGGWGGAFIRAPCTWTVGVRGPASCIRSMARLARAPSPPT